MRREEVFDVIDDEREYQENRWGDNSESTVGEYIAYMQHYMIEALRDITTNDTADAALNTIRKITTLGVACMEQHGASKR